MKFYIKHADTVAGVFILIAIAFLAGILILMGINQRWFAKDYEFTSTFASGNGLSVGMPIKLKGFEIGKVDSISLDDHNLVSIEFHIYDTYYDKIRVNSVLQLATSPIGLGSTLVFHPGRSPETMPEGSAIPSLDFPEGKRLAASGLVELPEGEDTITSILGKVGPILDSLRTTVDNITGVIDSLKATIAGDAQGPVGDIVMDARDTIGGTKLLVSGLQEDIGVIMGKADATLTNLEELTSDLKETEGLVTRLIDPQGSVATILSDDNQLYEKITGLLDSLDSTLGDIRVFTASISAASPQILTILEQSRVTIEKGKGVLEGVSNNPLIRGGIPKEVDQSVLLSGFRDEEF